MDDVGLQRAIYASLQSTSRPAPAPRMAPAPRRSDIMPTQPRSYGHLPRVRDAAPTVGRKNTLAREGMHATRTSGERVTRSPSKPTRAGSSGSIHTGGGPGPYQYSPPKPGSASSGSGDPLVSRRGNCVPGWTDASRGGKFQRMNPSGSQLQILCEDGWDGNAASPAYPATHLLLSTAALPAEIATTTHTLCLHVKMAYQASRAMLFGVVVNYQVEPPPPTASVDAPPRARFALVALQQQQGAKLCAQVLRCVFADGAMVVEESLTQSAPVVSGRTASSVAINPRDVMALTITKTAAQRLSFAINGSVIFKNVNVAGTQPSGPPRSPASGAEGAPGSNGNGKFGLCGVGVKALIRDIQIKEGGGDGGAAAATTGASTGVGGVRTGPGGAGGGGPAYHDRRGTGGTRGGDRHTPPAGVTQAKRGGATTSAAHNDDKFAAVIESEILNTNPNVQWEDIAALAEAKRLLNEAVVLPMIIPEFFTGIRTPWQGVLLFGPPGTGKTLLAKAVATCANTTFFNMTASTLLSKYHGESEKMIKTLFRLAREHAPSTIFFDEIDSLMMKRGDSHEHEASRRLKSELLSEMSGINTDNQERRVMILATSNKPWDLDEAFRRRLEKRIYIPLPEGHVVDGFDSDPAMSELLRCATHRDEAREELFRINLKDIPLAPDVCPAALAQMTDGYSGADIHQVCRDASMGPMRRLIANRTPMEIAQMKQQGLLTDGMELAMHDFADSIAKIHPSVNQNEIARYRAWEKDFAST